MKNKTHQKHNALCTALKRHSKYETSTYPQYILEEIMSKKMGNQNCVKSESGAGVATLVKTERREKKKRMLQLDWEVLKQS